MMESPHQEVISRGAAFTVNYFQRFENAEATNVLDLREFGLLMVPLDTYGLLKLVEIRLDYNRIESFPQDLAIMTHGHTLSVSHNSLKHCPSAISTWTRLTDLDLSHNKIEDIFSEIGGLIELKFLSLEHNLIQVLPYDLGALSNLTELRLDEHIIRMPPRTILDQGLHQTLRFLNSVYSAFTTDMLDFSSLGVPDFPLVATILPNVTRLLLFDNKLTSLPPSIKLLHALTDVSLSDNALTTLPDEICTLHLLQSLSLTRNLITHLPPAFAKLTHLTVFNNCL
jgi:hypothetical protein